VNITFLGTGTSQGVPLIGCDCAVCQSTDSRDKRLRTSILVQTDSKNIVIDSGPDFRQQMLSCGIKTLDGLVFTHAHKDHIAGMDDIRGFNFIMKKPIEIYCSDDVMDQMKKEFAYIFAEHKYPGIPDVSINQIYNDVKFDVAGIQITPIEVMHYKLPVMGFRINDFVYITDANFIADKEKEKIKGCHTLVLNALRKEKHISHFTLDEAIEIVHELKPKRAYFTHLSHQMGKHESVQKHLPDNIFIAHDNLTIQCP
jgi:phosphoribosyl 1,2-cyclic phosphate phosphodiesterase